MKKGRQDGEPMCHLRRQAEDRLEGGERDAGEPSLEEARNLLHELRTHQIELETQNEELRRTQGELAESRERYASLYDYAPVGYLTLDGKGLMVEANLTLAEMLGTERARLIRSPLSAFVSPEGQDVYYRHVQRMKETGQRQRYELKMQTGTGKAFWAQIDSVSMTAAESEDSQFRMTVSDITAQKRVEQGLRAAEERFQQISDNALVWIWEVDPEGLYTFASPAVEKILGYQPREVVGRKHFYDLFVSEDREELKEGAFQVFASRKAFREMINRNVHKDGRVVWLSTSGVPFFSDKGELLGYRGADTDITERKRAESERAEMEDRLRQAQRMQAVGTMAGGIAHDFNNVLGIIAGYVELACLDASPGTLQRKNLDQALRGVTRAKGITGQILAISRQREQTRKPMDLLPVIEACVGLVRASAPASIETDWNTQVESAMVSGVPSQIHQVLVNLCTNATQAMMSTGGALRIELTEKTVVPADHAAWPELKPGEYFSIAVSDTGCGMGREQLEQVFDPYFSSRPAGEGSGLGLSVASGIVQSHEGAIRAYSERGQGTTLHVMLPKLELEAQGACEAGEGEFPVAERPACVLFVDDEEGLVDYGQQILEHLGHKVVARTKSVDALEAFRAQPDKFDVVVTDLTMPKLTGMDLARELVRIRADIPVILCTGFSDRITPEEARAVGILEVLTKPVLVRDLTAAIQRALPDRTR